MKPNSAADPGLVFDSGWNDWLGFLCGTQLPTSFCTGSGIPVVSPSNFNGASIAISGLPGSQTVTRTVTNVGAKGTYSVSFSGAGISASVFLATFTLNPGQKQTLQITITNDRRRAQRLHRRPAHLVGRHAIASASRSSPARLPSRHRHRFLAATTSPSGTPAPSQPRPVGSSRRRPSPVPSTPTSSLSYDVVGPGRDDLRPVLAVRRQRGAGQRPRPPRLPRLRPSSAAAAVARRPRRSTSSIRLLPRTRCYVDGFATANPSTFTLFTWVLGSTAAGNMTVTAPATATIGGTGTINLSFSGLTAGTKYLGSRRLRRRSRDAEPDDRPGRRSLAIPRPLPRAAAFIAPVIRGPAGPPAGPRFVSGNA